MMGDGLLSCRHCCQVVKLLRLLETVGLLAVGPAIAQKQNGICSVQMVLVQVQVQLLLLFDSDTFGYNQRKEIKH